MKAALLVEHGNLIVTEVDTPVPGPGEVLLRVALGGICGSDHSLYHGKFGVPLPVIPGHEMIGRVERCGAGVSDVSPGQRVTVQPNFSCGTCALCLSGSQNLCPAKIRLGVDTNGVFAEFVKVPRRYVWPVPDDLPETVAVFTEPLAVGVHALKVCAPQPHDRTLIFGAGIMGLLTLQLAAARGAAVTACDLSPHRLALAAQLGAVRTVGDEKALQSLDNGFDLIYETSGAPGALARVVRLAAPKGRIVVLSLPGAEHPVSTVMIVRKELHIMGSLIYTDEFPEAVRTLQAGKVRTELLASGTIPLEQLDDRLKAFGSPQRVKTLVRI